MPEIARSAQAVRCVKESGVASRPRWYALSFADVLFVYFTLAILQHAGTGMMDDPGLGWHLRIADLMWESRGFVYQEQFCYPTEGQARITQAWLGDIVMRLGYAWGGLNGLAVFTALCVALTLRLLYTRMTREGVNWLLAAFWTFLAALGTAPAWVARPNLFTLPALVLVTGICERYHDGVIPARRTLWLLLIFLLWPNLHGGFLAGIIVLGVTYLVECATTIASPDREQRSAARRRLGWWTVLGAGLFAVTLVNPYGLGLYLWNLRLVADPFIQTETTTEWLPPKFTDEGWFQIEVLVLLFPTLAVLSRRRISLLALALGVVWLHFALTTARYSPLWVLVVVPTLATLSSELPWLERTSAKIAGRLSTDLREWLAKTPSQSPSFVSFAFAGLFLFVSPWVGNLAQHNQQMMPSQSLDKVLAIYRGERVFHWVNWGGYLTWHGWNLQPRFKTWIDDRIDSHGQVHLQRTRAILAARPDWEQVLEQYRVELLCISPDTPLASRAQQSPNWRLLSDDGKVMIFRRIKTAAPPVPARSAAGRRRRRHFRTATESWREAYRLQATDVDYPAGLRLRRLTRQRAKIRTDVFADDSQADQLNRSHEQDHHQDARPAARVQWWTPQRIALPRPGPRPSSAARAPSSDAATPMRVTRRNG